MATGLVSGHPPLWLTAGPASGASRHRPSMPEPPSRAPQGLPVGSPGSPLGIGEMDGPLPPLDRPRHWTATLAWWVLSWHEVREV